MLCLHFSRASMCQRNILNVWLSLSTAEILAGCVSQKITGYGISKQKDAVIYICWEVGYDCILKLAWLSRGLGSFGQMSFLMAPMTCIDDSGSWTCRGTEVHMKFVKFDEEALTSAVEAEWQSWVASFCSGWRYFSIVLLDTCCRVFVCVTVFIPFLC